LTALPKLDFSWIAIDRDQPRGPISLLRPRAAIGVAGTQPAPEAKLRLLNVGGGQTVLLNDTTPVPTVVISTIGNSRLRPETSRELEGGFDVELWRGRLTLQWTQFNKTKTNAIILVPVAPSASPPVADTVAVPRAPSTSTSVTSAVPAGSAREPASAARQAGFVP
jgi:outer membrane receptor protein involved in Fe transport